MDSYLGLSNQERAQEEEQRIMDVHEEFAEG